MSTPTKFTAEVRALILEALSYGLDRQSAAHYARIDPATLRRWMKNGETARSSSSRFAKFREDVFAAETEPKIGALKAVRDAWPDRPDLAWKFAERRIAGYAPPAPERAPARIQQQVVVLTLDDGRPITPALRAVANEAQNQAS